MRVATKKQRERASQNKRKAAKKASYTPKDELVVSVGVSVSLKQAVSGYVASIIKKRAGDTILQGNIDSGVVCRVAIKKFIKASGNVHKVPSRNQRLVEFNKAEKDSICFRIPKKLYDEAMSLCRDQQRSFSSFVRFALVNYLDSVRISR